jgi:hypothetical protein
MKKFLVVVFCLPLEGCAFTKEYCQSLYISVTEIAALMVCLGGLLLIRSSFYDKNAVRSNKALILMLAGLALCYVIQIISFPF